MESIVSQSTRSLSRFDGVFRTSSASESMMYSYFDQMTQNVHLPLILYYIGYLYVALQLIDICFWDPNMLDLYFFWAVDGTDLVIPNLVMICLFIFTLFSFFFPIIIYTQKHKFLTWSLYLSRFCLDFVIPICLTPLGWMFGLLLIEVVNNNFKTEIIVFLVMVVVITVFYFVFFTLSQQAFVYTAFLSKSPIFLYKAGPVAYHLTLTTILIYLESIFYFLPRWAWYILCALHFIVTAYIMYMIYDFPFFQYWMNAIYFSLLATTLVLDIVWITGVEHVIRASISLPIWIVFSILSYIFVRTRVKRINKLLQNPDVEEYGSIQNYLKEIKADQNSIKFLHVALLDHCPLLVDLLKLTVDNTNSVDHLCICLKTIVVFPSLGNLLNLFYNLIDSNVKLSFGQRFLLYQVNKIKLLRQSSASVTASQQLEEMKEYNRVLKARTAGFWAQDNLSFNYLAQLDKEIKLISIRWEQAVSDFPNSQIHREEYVRFLVDVKCDFQSACRHHYINSCIETGRNFSIDYCFRSLISVAPEYLKKGLVDIKGNLIEKNKKNGSASNSTGKTMTDTFSSSELDAKLEESIGKLILKQAKLRITLQNTLKSRKSNSLKLLGMSVAVNFIIAIVIFASLYGIYSNYYYDRSQVNSMSNLANQWQRDFSFFSVYQMLAFSRDTGRFNESIYMPLVEIKEPVPYESTWKGDEIYLQFGKYLYTSLFNFHELVKLMVQFSKSDINIFAFADDFFNDNVPMINCVANKKSEPVHYNLKTFYMNLYYNFGMARYSWPVVSQFWKMNDPWCNAFISLEYIHDSIEKMRMNLVTDEEERARLEKEKLKNIEFSIPLCAGVVMILFISISLALSVRETNNLVKMMGDISKEYKREATNTLLRTDNQFLDQNDQATGKNGSNAYIVYSAILTYAFIIIIIGLIVGMILQCEDINSKYESMSYWYYSTSIRQSLVLNTALNAYELVLINGTNPVDQEMFTPEEKIKRIDSLTLALRYFRRSLESGTKTVDSILGINPDIDQMINKPYCDSNMTGGSMHDTYSCGSINQQLAMFDDYMTEISAKVAISESTLNTEMMMNSWHIIYAHIIPQLIELDARLENLMEGYKTGFKNMLLVFFIIGIIVTILFTIFGCALIQMLSGPYNAALILLHRVSPVGIVNNTKLIDYLLNRHTERNSSEMTTTRAIVYNANDGIFLLSHQGTIESMNLSVTRTLGYTPEQLLGQHIHIIFCDTDKERVKNQLQFMISKQSGNSFEDHFNCVSDTEQTIPCHVMIFGMTSGGANSDIESFVFVMHDESELMEQQIQAEKAKKQSEDLLYQILPRDIVIRLNQGEKDISFEVPSASVMFIDIVKFSEFSSSLSPTEIMGTLSTLFGAFDESLARFPLITKIKLIGDVYMCAAGLFTPNEAPQHHAEQTLRFGLEALQIVDETNMKMTTNLSVRVGVNSGGPLIAGVLGTDKPVFDIIGDTINIASRLQSTDISGRIQISQTTYDLIVDLDFNIEPRGEVFLKGKGKTNAFLVKPYDGILSHSSNLKLSTIEIG